MDFIRENKGIAIILALVVVAGAAYLLFGSSGGSAPSDSLLTSSQGGTATSPISRELLSTLSDLRGIRLDESVFDDATFTSLVDFGTEIPPQPLGRNNPFAPLGAPGAATGSTR